MVVSVFLIKENGQINHYVSLLKAIHMSLECANQIFKIPTIHGNKKGAGYYYLSYFLFLNLFKLKSAEKCILKYTIHCLLKIPLSSIFELMLEKCLYFTVISPFSLINFTLLFPLSTLLLFNTR